MTNYLTQNSKLRKTSKKAGERVFNWGIPAFLAADGFKTCPNAAACAVGCYARSGAYRFSNVAQAFEKRLALTKTSKFIDIIKAELIKKRVDTLRIHDSGDFYSPEYLNNWLIIVDALPDIYFYAYTKQVSLFKLYEKLPANLLIIYSYGGKQDTLIDPKKDRHSRVFETTALLKKAGYADASNDDLIAVGLNHKIGLVYHGNKNYTNTDWNKVKNKG